MMLSYSNSHTRRELVMAFSAMLPSYPEQITKKKAFYCLKLYRSRRKIWCKYNATIRPSKADHINLQ